jgi:hypothetical protein
MKDDYLDKVVHNLTHRRFKNTSRQSVYQLGSSVSNSFYDPRNIGNFDSGEIDPEGRYATHYPVNAGSNTMGFSIMDDGGDDKRYYYPSTISSNVNALEMKKGGALGSSSSGSSSDYMYFNPYYKALLNPQSHKVMEAVAQPHFRPTPSVSFREGVMEGRGTNAPSSGSAVDFAMNNPYAFKSNFNGGALGASSSGSASDYYDSNPNRVPAIQSESRHYSDFMMEGGAIDWAKYLGYIKKGVYALPELIAKAPEKIIKTADAIKKIQELRESLKPVKKEIYDAFVPKKPAPKHEEFEYEEEPEDEFEKISRRPIKPFPKPPHAPIRPAPRTPKASPKPRKKKTVVSLDI